jgi:glycosyltransferase involved in cell wall biosynthesis
VSAAPLVSIVVPCFNAAPWLAETIASARAQSYTRREIVCVDDGSTDETPALLRALAGDDLVVITQPNRGQSAALNRGLAASRGEYVQFLDADDLLHPDKIAKQLSRLADAPGAVAVSEWARFSGDAGAARFASEPCWHDDAPLAWLARAWHDGGGMLFPARWLLPRATLARVAPWDESLTVHNDGEYFTRVVLASARVLHVAGARAYYRSGLTGSVSGRRDARSQDSYYRSLLSMEASVTAQPWHEASRRGLALMWQRFAYGAHPYAPELADEAMRRARALHAARLPIDGGWRFRCVAALAGWRFARRLQRWSGRA